MTHLDKNPYEAPSCRGLLLLIPQDVFTGSTIIHGNDNDVYEDQDDTENWS
jgi:hypothetical protein